MKYMKNHLNLICRNPYFIGINSAIVLAVMVEITVTSRNPYFIGINSAIQLLKTIRNSKRLSQSLFYWN